MKKAYKIHCEITRELLNTIKVDDLIKCNDWAKPMRVKAVSRNYVLAIRSRFGRTLYSIIEKKECKFNYNDMKAGMFHCGTDNLIFGPDVDFNNNDECTAFLRDFEVGKLEMSVRRSTALYGIQIKRG